jgi:hypothetical protein
MFSPCTRLHDILESQGRLGAFRGHNHKHLKELYLNVSTEELLSSERAFTYAGMYAMLESGRTVAWLTPHAAVVRSGGNAFIAWDQQLGVLYRFCFNADGKDIVASARYPSIYWRFAMLLFDCWQ